MTITTISANSRDDGDLYLLLQLAHSMAGQLANSDSKSFHLAHTYSQERLGITETTWSNGIIDLSSRVFRDSGYREYQLSEAKER